jgi:hypothetical protein
LQRISPGERMTRGHRRHHAQLSGRCRFLLARQLPCLRWQGMGISIQTSQLMTPSSTSQTSWNLSAASKQVRKVLWLKMQLDAKKSVGCWQVWFLSTSLY